jgi:Dipeptidyl aminopeptidases/acylaminoacyl-peptidases
MELGGYVTLRQDKVKKHMPLIVLPHGGPASSDTYQFDWLAQALASRGYMVFQPNFRGSTGQGEQLFRASFGEWGGKMQSDVTDGVTALVKNGLVDAKRICIVGMSYGGYVAQAGVTMQKDIYRCAVSVAGISDLRAQFANRIQSTYLNDVASLRFDLRYVGAKSLDDPILVERSPLTHAKNLEVPLLIIHGDNDAVVQVEQSKRMANALKKAGKPYEFVKLKSEDHWLSKADTRLQMLQAVVKFLETNNPP